MAADQRRKRLNGANIVGYGSRDQQRTKRKNVGTMQNGMNIKSHISVEWDGSQKRVVAKREQVGICWRQMKPFVNFVPNGHNVLADVFSIPQEIFDLDDLSEVLSYEVWKTHLSENERNVLMHFLPRGLEPHQVVQELLAGDNFHFGSPFLEWGALLCSGDLHPDTIVKREEHLKSEKRAYYSELHNYHDDMIGYFMEMKEIWESCRDPEREFLQKIWRSKNEVEEKKLSTVKESKVHDHDEYVTATSESCSWAAEEKGCSSDNQISSWRKSDKLQKKVFDKGSVKGKSRNFMIASDEMISVGARPKKGDKVLKRNIHSSDGHKYMSCIMISKKQHELVKSMKQSGKSIQSRSLNRVLGNLDNIHVQPYEVFIKEEQKKLHEHWLQVVNKDLPVSYVNWSERQTQRQALLNSLVVEMKDKWKTQLEDEDNVNGNKLQDEEDDGVILQDQEDDSGMLQDQETNGGMLQDQDADGDMLQDQEDDGDILQDQDYDGGVLQDHEDDGGLLQDQEDDGSMLQDQEDDGSMLQDQEDDGSMLQDLEDDGSMLQDQEDDGSMLQDQEDDGSMLQDQEDDGSMLQDQEDDGSMFQDQEDDGSMLQDQEDDGGVNNQSSSEGNQEDEDFVAGQPKNQPPCDSYLGDKGQFNPVSMDSGKNIVVSKMDDAPRNKTEYSTNRNTQDVTISEGAPLSSGDAWQAVEMPHSYYDSTVTHGYTASGMALGNPQSNDGQRTRLIDLESDLHQEETPKELLHRQTDNGSFGSYLNQNRSDLLQSLFKAEGILSYHHNQKGAGLDFQTSNNVMFGDGQFPGHFEEPLQTSLTLDQGQRRSTEVYMPENISDNIYSDRHKYLIPRQDSLPAVNVNDWAATAARIPAPSHSHLNTGEFMGQHWFPADHQVRGGWNGSDGASLPSQGLGNGGNCDQSLFSVLSQCTQLRSNSPYDSARHTDQFLSSRTYGALDAGPPRINAVVPQASHPLDYLGGREVPDSVVPDDMGWMSLPHQNSALHDQMGKPYLRSWNR